MYFLGAEHLALAFTPMWDRIGAEVRQQPQGRRRVPERLRRQRLPRGLPPGAQAPPGYTLDLSTAYPDGLTNYTSMISQFKSHGDDFFTNVPLPPDFATMWTQALQQGFKPKLATVAKVLLFPTDAYAHGLQGLQHRHRRLVGARAALALLAHRADLPRSSPPRYTAAGLGQPNQNISNYTLFEIAYAALSAVNNPHDKTELSAALFKVKLPEAVAGPLDYTSTNPKTNPAPGVAITPPVGIQWQKGTKYPLEAKVVDNTLQPNAKITGDLLPDLQLNTRTIRKHD